ncbi:hypothetical protein GCM10011390_10240 [Aureimonas endophytica]|uniref:HTH cro/C1-type domain-containing protein n=1 Tax=Aureimonas endophytica TaxID=2027858 RepID=A0A916ZEZ8_9HYPH|nr:helix-turn-helix transcriptional regulator [Aureimonas endophytica]GGD93414.1 hypothetical protein GCM10011390_10240 [Aureimonas endophytica]
MRIDDGRQIRAARAILGMTVQELADAAGLHKNSVLTVEAKKRIRRAPHTGGGHSVSLIEKAIEARGVICDLIDGQPIVRFTTTAPPPKYQRRRPAAN